MKKILHLELLTTVLFAFLSHSMRGQIPAKAADICPILIGEKLPAATLRDIRGDTVELQDIIARKPTVLIFYRGGWCPYCNRQLAGLAEREKDILKQGWQIVAISPEDYRNLEITIEKDSIGYELYSDSDGTLIRNIGIAFQSSALIRGYMAAKGQKGRSSAILPVPTVLLVDRAGKIVFEYINPNYKERMDGRMLMAVLYAVSK